MRTFPRFGACALVLALSASTRAGESRDPDTAVVVPGARYEAGPVFRTFFGSAWREHWTTPILVRKLDLSTFDGGLTPVRRGGGQQTKSLRLESKNGRHYAFRSVDKDPTRLLDEETRASKAADLVRDVTSTAHPTAALVVAPLLDAVGVLNATPELFVMPDDPRLGEFRDFAGMLGLLELRPGRGHEGADKALGTLELFARLEQRSDERVDARNYLRARLIDVLVGDWDRHVSQWRWLRFREDGGRSWRPVPRDRDQAFARFGGILPSIGEYYTKQLSSFGDDYPAIDKLTFSGRYTDRRFLAALSETDWREVTSDVVARLTNEIIAAAVRRLPPEQYARGGAELERTLRARRDKLPAASREFYRLLAENVDVYGTEQADLARIRWLPDGAELTVSARDEDTGELLDPPYFHRHLRDAETSEIRLYLLGGADQVVEEGERHGAIRLYVVRGDPRGAGWRQGAMSELAPARDGDDAAEALEDEEQLSERYERFRDWGTDWLVFPQLSYDGTRGLFAGARVERTHFGFGRDPFADRMTIAGAWSTGLDEPRLEYQLDVRTRSPFGALAYVAYSGVDFAYFYGLGNESARDSTLASRNFYRVHQHRFVVRPLVTASLAGPLRARAGFGLEHFSNSPDAPGPASRAYGTGDMALASAEVGLGLDTRTSPTRRWGVEADVSVRHFPSWLDNAAAFTKARAEVSAGIGAPRGTDLLLAVRVAGEKNWGRYPYFQAASIGGVALPSPLGIAAGAGGNMLRGYDLNRFAGDSSVVANADLRIPIGRYSDIVPLRYGLLALADVGRVFEGGETSSKWHPSAGGGAWVALHIGGTAMEFTSMMSFLVVRSDEGTSFLLSSTFGF